MKVSIIIKDSSRFDVHLSSGVRYGQFEVVQKDGYGVIIALHKKDGEFKFPFWMNHLSFSSSLDEAYRAYYARQIVGDEGEVVYEHEAIEEPYSHVVDALRYTSGTRRSVRT